MSWRACTEHDWVSNSPWWILPHSSPFCNLFAGAFDSLSCRLAFESWSHVFLTWINPRDSWTQHSAHQIWGKGKNSMPEQRTAVVVFSGLQGWLDNGWEALVINWRKHMILCDKWVWIRCPQSWKGALDFSLSCRIGFAQYLATIGSATCLLCSSTKQSHLTSWLNADCIMITPMDSEVALIFNVFMLPFHHSLPRLLYQSLIPLTFCCYLPDSALDTAFWGWKMIEEWNRTPSLATWVGRSSVQESCDRSRMLHHVVPCCTKYS